MSSKLHFSCHVKKEPIREMVKWCKEMFGERWELGSNTSGEWSYFWAGVRNKDFSYVFYFDSEQKLMLFVLTWGVYCDSKTINTA